MLRQAQHDIGDRMISMISWTLKNDRGTRVVLSSLGASISGIFVPDNEGNVADVTVAAGESAGKTIGRYANRIARGELVVDGKRFALLTNEGHNTLHGGPDGFSKRNWEMRQSNTSLAEFALRSPDGDQGFPGTMDCRVRYTWNDDDELTIDYFASTDKPTVINLTNHVYFNLSGRAASDIADQQLQISASAFTPLDDELIPTGAIATVEGTSRDFRTMRPLTDELYDCNFVVDDWNGELRHVATAYDAQSGRNVAVRTTQPGLQLYTGKRGAFALETQHFADAPHHPNFPSTVLRPGEIFHQTTMYRFALGEPPASNA
jgi:aldose 1-epimerase